MGNFSRNTFDTLKHYVGVRLQQGVPLIDADWNEQEDIRKFELQAFLKWFAGNGVPKGNDGFRILAATGNNNDFDISGGDGTPEGAGRCLVEGFDVMNETTGRYSAQLLYNNAGLASQWGVDPVSPLTTPGSNRIDTVYLDVWEREVDSSEDSDLINPAIGMESCVRMRREWAVRVVQGSLTLPAPAAGHFFYPIARLKRPAGSATISSSQIEDLRTVDVNLSDLVAEIVDARGIKGNLGNRLDESLTKGGQLRHNVVADNQVQAGAGINESKILFSPGGHDHSGVGNGNQIATAGLEDNAVTRAKLDIVMVSGGSIADLAPGATSTQLVQANVGWKAGLSRIYLPTISIVDVTGSGIANVTSELRYSTTAASDTYNVHIRITNASGGSELVDVFWYVYMFSED